MDSCWLIRKVTNKVTRYHEAAVSSLLLQDALKGARKSMDGGSDVTYKGLMSNGSDKCTVG